MENIPTPILVTITSYLSLDDLISLKLTNKHFLKILESQKFWSIFYGHVYGKNLSYIRSTISTKGKSIEDTFIENKPTDSNTIWKDLLKLDSLIRNLDSNEHITQYLQENVIAPYLGLSCHIPIKEFKPCLVEIYLKLKGVDMLDSSKMNPPGERPDIGPYAYLRSLIELSPIDDSDQHPKSFVNATRVAERGAEIILKTPSRRFFNRISDLIDETDKEMTSFYTWMNSTSAYDVGIPTSQSRKYFIEYIIKGISQEISSMNNTNDIEEFLNKQKRFMKIMGINLPCF